MKFFGFELSQIKALLLGKVQAAEHFSAQVLFLEEKANALLEASKTLRSILSDVNDDKSIPWETIIKLIEVYRMSQKLEHSWVKEIFSPEEFQQYVDFENEMKSKSTQADFKKSWASIVEDIKKNLNKDPNSETGIAMGEKFMKWINGVYGKKYAHLRTKKFEKGFAEGKGLEEVGLTIEMVSWIDKATDAYWHHRAYTILAEVGKNSEAEVLTQWNEMLDDMYGDDATRKMEIYPIALQDDKISAEAKKWLQSLIK